MPGWRDCWSEPIVDSLGVVSVDAHGDVVVACAGLEETAATTVRQNTFLTRVAMHLGSADRIRRRPKATHPDAAEAVLDAKGAVVHLTDTRAETREAIADGVARKAFAQKNRDAPEKGLEVWQGLIAGRWSLVDFFDNDGKRFVLAMKNTPRVGARAELTPRERRVAALVATGHRDKEIAYMLGLSLAAVTTALRRARLKLGVETRAELAASWRRNERG